VVNPSDQSCRRTVVGIRASSLYTNASLRIPGDQRVPLASLRSKRRNDKALGVRVGVQVLTSGSTCRSSFVRSDKKVRGVSCSN